MDESQRRQIYQKEPNTKEYKLCDSMQIVFQNRQTIMVKIRTVIVEGKRGGGKNWLERGTS